jgi:DNA-binding NtrC family response regulator
MTTKQELENLVEKRVKPIVEKAMHDFLGVTITEIEEDISDKIKHSPLIDFEINTKIPFKKAKKDFKKVYLSRLLKQRLGNISDVAKISGLDRRSVHRLIIELKIKIENFRKELEKQEYTKHEAVQNIVEETVKTYKSALNPNKLKEFYKHAPSISKNIAKELPKEPLTLSAAEKEFEKAYLKKALIENKNNISKTAKKIGLRFETLHRKLKSLKIQVR